MTGSSARLERHDGGYSIGAKTCSVLTHVVRDLSRYTAEHNPQLEVQEAEVIHGFRRYRPKRFRAF